MFSREVGSRASFQQGLANAGGSGIADGAGPEYPAEYNFSARPGMGLSPHPQGSRRLNKKGECANFHGLQNASENL